MPLLQLFVLHTLTSMPTAHRERCSRPVERNEYRFIETSTGLFMFTNCFWLLLLSCFVDTQRDERYLGVVETSIVFSGKFSQ